MIARLISQIIAGVIGFWLAFKFIPGIYLDDPSFLKTLIFSGIIFGLFNFFLTPALKIITFPLRIITFNLFNIIILLGLVWLTDLILPQIKIEGFLPLFETGLILWLANLLVSPIAKLSKI